MKFHHTSHIGVGIIIFALGYFTHATIPSAQAPDLNDNEGTMEQMDPKSTMVHTHIMKDISGSNQIPTINLETFDDPKSGFNLHLLTENFVFAPESASTNHKEGEGHAHLYIDDVKIGRIYSDWIHIDKLESGMHEILITLNGNDHEDLANGEEAISASQMVEVK
jgi:hypothetical protein